MVSGAAVGLQRLDGQVGGYYSFHAALSDLLRRSNLPQAAAEFYGRALARCGNRTESAYLKELDKMLKCRRELSPEEDR